VCTCARSILANHRIQFCESLEASRTRRFF
jgi:hypothetical protein